jgi:hypothetical protein
MHSLFSLSDLVLSKHVFEFTEPITSSENKLCSVLSSQYFPNKVHLRLWLKFDINYDPCLELSGHLCCVVFMGCMHTYSLSSDASVLSVCTLFKSQV